MPGQEYPDEPLSERLPGTIEFDTVECCALDCAIRGVFKGAPEVFATLGNSGPNRNPLKFSPDEFAKTNLMVFVPTPDMRIALEQFAKMGKEALEPLPQHIRFACGHLPEEHNEALEAVIRKLRVRRQ